MVAKEYGVDIDMSNGLPLERRPSFDQRASDFPSDKELFPVEEVPDALIEYPDGGLRAWLVVVGAFFTVFCGFGLANGAGAFQTLYRETLLKDYSESDISWISAVQNFLMAAPAIFTGSLFDKYGHRPLVAVGGILITLGFVFLSLSTEYYQIFLCHTTLIALGCNLLFITPLGCLGQWFDKKRGLAFGCMSCGSSAGAVCWPLVLANLPDKVGFGWTCRIMALVAAICSTISFFAMKTRLPPKPPGRFFAFEAFKEVEYQLLVGNFFFWSFGYLTFQLYIGTYGQILGFGSYAPYLLIISNGSSMVGRLSSGIGSDYLGVVNMTLIGNSLLAVMLWVWLACRSIASCTVLVIIAGFASGAFVCLQAPYSNKSAPDMRAAGTRLGQAIGVQGIGTLVGLPSFGGILGERSSVDLTRFSHAIILAAGCMCISAGCVLASKLRWNRKFFAKV